IRTGDLTGYEPAALTAELRAWRDSTSTAGARRVEIEQPAVPVERDACRKHLAERGQRRGRIRRAEAHEHSRAPAAHVHRDAPAAPCLGDCEATGQIVQ